jgi:signal transduction histidine kinase
MEPQMDGRASSPPDSLDSPELGRPFRLVKYFSYTGFTVILVFTLLLTLFISSQAKDLALSKSEDYGLLLGDNLNHQVFLQFVVPVALRDGRIRLREPQQYKQLDTVVRNTIHSLNVEVVNMYDLEGNLVYSTEPNRAGTIRTDEPGFREALTGRAFSRLDLRPGGGLFNLGQTYALRTYTPFRAEKQFEGAVGKILGVFEIHQDLSQEYAEITRFQWGSLAIGLGFNVVLFFILRQILLRGERIIDRRNEERRKLQDRLHQSERLANLGQMVAAVSHEIRNPLGIISSTAELLEERFRKYEPNDRLASVIVEESRRLGAIVTEFLDFARPQAPRIQPCRVEDVLEQNLAFLGPVLDKEGIEVARDYDLDQTIEADPDLLYRAFLNLFINAVQAMPEGGLLTVTTRPAAGNGQSPALAEIVVADTGAGVDPAAAAQVFTPFFTTKNRGSGLGLAIVKNIVDSHRGQVAIEAAQDGGTRLIIRLPVHPA